MGFIFGGEADNHAVNTVPKECLISVTKLRTADWAAEVPGSLHKRKVARRGE